MGAASTATLIAAEPLRQYGDTYPSHFRRPGVVERTVYCKAPANHGVARRVSIIIVWAISTHKWAMPQRSRRPPIAFEFLPGVALQQHADLTSNIRYESCTPSSADGFAVVLQAYVCEYVAILLEAVKAY